MELRGNLGVGEIRSWVNCTSFHLNEIQWINKRNRKTPLTATDTDINKGHQEPFKYLKLDWNMILKSGKVCSTATMFFYQFKKESEISSLSWELQSPFPLLCGSSMHLHARFYWFSKISLSMFLLIDPLISFSSSNSYIILIKIKGNQYLNWASIASFNIVKAQLSVDKLYKRKPNYSFPHASMFFTSGLLEQVEMTSELELYLKDTVDLG